MGTYVEVQGRINDKRMQEYEAQLKAAEAAQQQQLTTTEEQQPVLPVAEEQPIVEVQN